MPSGIVTCTISLAITLMVLTGCGFVVPGTPGHEPPAAGEQ